MCVTQAVQQSTTNRYSQDRVCVHEHNFESCINNNYIRLNLPAMDPTTGVIFGIHYFSMVNTVY